MRKKDKVRKTFFSLYKQLFIQNYDLFQQLKTFLFEIPSYEAYGRQRRRRKRENGLTPHSVSEVFIKHNVLDVDELLKNSRGGRLPPGS
jgi:hypothetical protein